MLRASGLLHPRWQLALLRALLAIQLVERGAWPLLGLACAAAGRPRSWWASLATDLQRAAEATTLWENKPPANVPDLRRLARAGTSACRALIKRAFSWASETALSAAVLAAENLPSTIGTEPLLHGCKDCSASFCSHVALAVHAAKCHGYRQEARRYALDHSCSICLLVFGSRMRLVRHLARPDSICLYNARRLGLALSSDELAVQEQLSAAQARDARRAGRRECWSSTHTWQALGPARPLGWPPHLRTGRLGNPVLRLALRPSVGGA